MPKVTFEYNLSKIEGHIKKEDTFYREAIKEKDWLCVKGKKKVRIIISY